MEDVVIKAKLRSFWSILKVK